MVSWHYVPYFVFSFNNQIKEEIVFSVHNYYLDGNEIQNVTEGQNATEKQNATEIQSVIEIPKIKEYTLEELAEYNGKNGTAYVAYQGNVYDVSNSDLWKGGIHKGHIAGKDLTEEMGKAPHGPEILKGFPVVGTLKK